MLIVATKLLHKHRRTQRLNVACNFCLHTLQLLLQLAFSDFFSDKNINTFTSQTAKMSKQKKHTFILSDESINAYGFRVLTDGIDLSAFEKNPVAFWNHRIDDRWKETPTMPIGKWSNLRKENGRLLGDLEIDIDDPLGKELERKINNGYVNAVSINFDPIEISDAKEHLLVGQTRSTLTKSLLLECSPVGLPGNYGAVKLKQKEGGFLSLNSTSTAKDIDAIIPRLNNTSIKNSNMTTEQKQLLGLDANATDEQVTTALNALKAKAEKTGTTENPATTPATSLNNEDKTELENLRKERVTTLINGAIADKKITEAERETYTELANGNFESTKKAIEKMQPSVKITSLLQNGGSATATSTATKVEDCEFMKLSKNNPTELARIQTEDVARFNTIKEEYIQLLKNK